MKFLCPSCKAKYQIADEKVAGRTLKMDCRRCGHAIMLRGDQPPSDESAGGGSSAGGALAVAAPARPVTRAPSTAGRLPAPAAAAASSPRRPAGRPGAPTPASPSSASRPGTLAARSALSADFRRSAGAPPPITPEPRTTALDQWHVAIHDVPVGPMKREEIGRKIATGAIHGGSLAWREGFDDWRPLRDIPELSTLLRKNEPVRSSERPATRSSAGRPAPPPSRAAAPTPSRPGMARPAGTATPAAASRTGAPGGRSNVVAIGGRMGAAAAPALEDGAIDEEVSDELDGDPTRVASMFDLPFEEPRPSETPAALSTTGKKPEKSGNLGLPSEIPAPPSVAPLASASVPSHAPSSPKRESSRRALPIGAWIGIAGAIAFGVTMAVMLAPRLLGPAEAVAPTAATTAIASPAGPREATVETDVPEPVVPPTAAPAEEPVAAAETTPTADVEARAPTKRSAPSTTVSASTPAAGAAASTKQVDPAFARFANDGHSTLAPIAQRSQASDSRRGTGSGEGLNADQIRTVVAREQRGLQACWEVAIRGLRTVPTTRMDVDVTIGQSGSVTQATARGVGVGNLSECLERNVRRWRFPASGDTSRTSFPVVFQGTS